MVGYWKLQLMAQTLAEELAGVELDAATPSFVRSYFYGECIDMAEAAIVLREARDIQSRRPDKPFAMPDCSAVRQSLGARLRAVFRAAKEEWKVAWASPICRKMIWGTVYFLAAATVFMMFCVIAL